MNQTNTTRTNTYALCTDARMNRGGCFRVTARNQKEAKEVARAFTSTKATSSSDRVVVTFCQKDNDRAFFAEGVSVTELTA